jgi:hypothetical protein
MKQRVLMASLATYGTKKQLFSRHTGRQTNVHYIIRLQGLYILMKVKAGRSEGKIKICSEFLKEGN